MYKKLLLLPSRTDVIAEAAQSFPQEDGSFIMGILDLYGQEPNEPHREFMQIAIVRYAEGNVEKLLNCVEAAKRDYKKFLWHEAFAPHPAESSGMEFMPSLSMPLAGEHTKEVAAGLLSVDWPQIDEWVASGLLTPISKQRGQCRFDGEELERFQRARDDANNVDIDEVWKQYSP